MASLLLEIIEKADLVGLTGCGVQGYVSAVDTVRLDEFAGIQRQCQSERIGESGPER